ncbi:MAG: carbamoyltransferase HypF [Pseudomonadota bacterium]
MSDPEKAIRPVTARQLTISGVVQGVGFRPFVYQLARIHGLKGEVWNTPQGVAITLEGPEKDMDQFCRDLKDRHPPLASVRELIQDPVPVKGYTAFSIGGSSSLDADRSALIPPDVTVCPDCLREMQDPKDRRFRYPFINCTNCGPRYTIIKDIPYDRPKTSMGVFAMCGPCRREYDDPGNRRFHAQPNACPVCGPHAFLVDNRGKPVDIGSDDPIAAAAKLLTQGAILAVKGLGGFHLAVDATLPDSVRKLRLRKKRPHKPFALMAASVASMSRHVRINDAEKALLESIHRPIVLLEKKDPPDPGNPVLAPDLAPMNLYLGFMLPYTPLHVRLFETGPRILVMTSGNRSGEPLSIDNKDALEAFAHIADYFLLHNRDIYFRADDSIVQVQENKTRFFRRSRGYAPLPVLLRTRLPQILACGGGLKSTVCLTKEDRAFLSQHIGDLDDPKSYDFFVQSIGHLRRILDINPGIIAHDMHPGYISTVYALDQTGMKTVAVQHHHAHAVSCMAENKLDREVIALTLDGTGYGTDGRIWGGEILTCTETGFRRRAHLSYTPMPGGDAAVLEPWRMGAAFLRKALGDDFLDLDIDFIHRLGREKLAFVARMMEKSINSPLTSSCGRLFDAVAAILGIRDVISFESQAAMELQALSRDASATGYTVAFRTLDSGGSGDAVQEMDMGPMFRELVRDLQEKQPLARIGARFHRTVINTFVRAALEVREETGINEAVLSGGVFNNAILFKEILKSLEENGMDVYTHTRVPCGDGGVSLGQAVAAGAMERKLS